MSKTTAPLLSFGATGQIGKTMVASTWKGISYMRKYTVPANPNTAAQQTQRALITASVSAYRNYFTHATGRAAWNYAASASGKAQSGFNLFTSNNAKMCASDADASFADEASEAANVVTIAMLNSDDGGDGDEAGNFALWVGTTPSNLLYVEDIAIAAGDIVCTVVAGAIGTVEYFQLRKDGYDRSGTYKITLSGV